MHFSDGLLRWKLRSLFCKRTQISHTDLNNVFTVQHRDRFFHANDLGDLIIAKMSPNGYQEVSRAHLIEPTHDIGSRTLVWSHPAFANERVYLRNDKEIRCYSLRAVE